MGMIPVTATAHAHAVTSTKFLITGSGYPLSVALWAKVGALITPMKLYR
jgi:hypothetical protein